MTIQETQDLQDGLDPAISLASMAYERIKMKLIMLEIRPGSPINDGALAAELGVGRTPVREALKRLETDHLVASFPRRGTFATGVDITDLRRSEDTARQVTFQAPGVEIEVMVIDDAVPVMRILAAVYSWRVRARIYRWYGEL